MVLGVPHETIPNLAIWNHIAQASATFNIQMGKPRGRHAEILEKCDHVSVGLEITGWGWSKLKRKASILRGYYRLNLCQLITPGQIPPWTQIDMFVCMYVLLGEHLGRWGPCHL